MGAFGARLKAAREQRGVSLRQIAGATRISMTALEALERDDFSRLPGGIFSRAFIRAYAIEIGLDPEATVSEFLVEVGRYEREAATVTSQPEVTDEDRAFLERQRRATVALRAGVVVLVVAVVSLILWQGQRLLHEFSPTGRTTARTVEAPPPTAPAPADTPTGTENGSLTVEFTVNADCSVQVSTDGLRVFYKDMRAGESKKFVAQRELLVEVDNAGAFVWTINSRPAKALGAVGERKKATITAATIASYLQ
jgi:cytoskeletal protein RodZ